MSEDAGEKNVGARPVAAATPGAPEAEKAQPQRRQPVLHEPQHGRQPPHQPLHPAGAAPGRRAEASFKKKKKKVFASARCKISLSLRRLKKRKHCSAKQTRAGTC